MCIDRVHASFAISGIARIVSHEVSAPLQVVTHEIPVRGNLRGICTRLEAPQEVITRIELVLQLASRSSIPRSLCPNAHSATECCDLVSCAVTSLSLLPLVSIQSEVALHMYVFLIAGG